MLKHKNLEHRFVDTVPDKLQPGVLYVAMEYGTVTHSCCCGCGEEVVTPLTPTDWKLMYDGDTVSLWPSVGSWTLKCKSHYIIDRGQAVASGAWTPAQIAAERRRDQAAKGRFYGKLTPEVLVDDTPLANPVTTTPATREKEQIGRWTRLKRWWKSRKASPSGE